LHIFKLNAPSSISAGAPHQTPLRELTSLSRPPNWIFRSLLLSEREGRGEDIGERRGEGRKGTEGKGE